MGMWPFLSVIFLLYIVHICSAIQTGFWYGDTRPPNTQYENVPYANMTVKVNRPFQEGPGQNLISDPFNPGNPLYAGNTINRQSFDTQFILDLSYALDLETHRIYVTYVRKGDVHFSWESSSVIVQFIILERNGTIGNTLLEVIADLTASIQEPTSKLYYGTNVTNDIDPLYGLVVDTWDISLKLSYAIEIVGGDAVVDKYYLNQGGLGLCDGASASLYPMYCEFERFFEDDVSRALNISYYRVQVMFIKVAAYDSVLVYFRILPEMLDSHEYNVTSAVQLLLDQVHSYSSPLYTGNVTIRVDPIWGVSGTHGMVRTAASLFTLKYYELDPSRLLNPKRMLLYTSYDRCKANHRCNWGVIAHDQNTNDVRIYQRFFDNGDLYETNLFLDFEDWRLGARGFSWTGVIPPTEKGMTSIPRARAAEGTLRGAHFWPFDQASLGPDIPCYLLERNQGLVLDRTLQRSQIDMQEALVDDLRGRIDWLENNIEWAAMGPQHRARKDVRENLTWVRADYIHWWENEVLELRELNSSQCVSTKCYIQFNTSSLELTGAIADTGVIRMTNSGTEVAVFSFNSIYLGPEVEVIVVGQRAMALISKTTAIINTTIHANPGTLGGFPGGGSVARYPYEALSDTPTPILMCQLGGYCDTTNSSSPILPENVISNNVNGPGSGNLRVNPFVIETSASYIPEIQVITTTAQPGQTLAGGFQIHFKTYSTPIIPHDVSSLALKSYIEDNLNLAPPKNYPVSPNRLTDGVAGVGIVNITRTRHDNQEGFVWYITFTTAIGDIDQMTVTSYLQGLQARISIRTLQQGNELRGFFTLSFQGMSTLPIFANESADGLRNKLLRLPMVSTAFVSRIDPTGNCDDGLCFNGPKHSRGLIWTVYITTNSSYDDITPTSPTSPLTRQEAPAYRVTAVFPYLLGSNAYVNVTYGLSNSPDEMMSLMNIRRPFSLAWGGGGGGYGGLGGKGYSINPPGAPYNDKYLTDLLGGSGGAMRSPDPFEANAFKSQVVGLGGAGGGAIEIIASNDVVIGSLGKIEMPGEDGQQSSQGGGGGGSGGAILISAGNSILFQGVLDVHGGHGGFGGFEHLDMAGGGGGGGRIALFAESIILQGQPRIDGGACGVYKIPVSTPVLVANVTLHLGMISPLSVDRIAYLGGLYVNDSIPTLFVNFNDYSSTSLSNITVGALHLELVIDTVDIFNTSTLLDLEAALNKRMGIDYAEVFVFYVTISNAIMSTAFPVRSQRSSCANNGAPGSFYSEATMTTSMFVAPTQGAENTSRALFFSNREVTNTTSGSQREAPFSWNGPMVPFEASQPNRVTFYMKLDYVPGESTKSNYGVLFSLLSRGVSGLNVSNAIGVFFGYQIMHGANFGSAVDEKYFLKRMVIIDNYPTLDRWYKFDIRIDWSTNLYSIAIDDAVVAANQTFSGDDVDGIRFSVTRAVDFWVDEIYVGFDSTMNFVCPSLSRTGTQSSQPVQKHWSYDEVHGGGAGYTAYNKMQRHYNFLDPTGSIPFDGQGAVLENQDIKLQYSQGDYPWTQGKLHAGALQYITHSLRSGKTGSPRSATLISPKGLWYQVPDSQAGDGRQFWYTEYNYNSTLTSTMNGGVAACSSQDMRTWRFEGIVFHYTNLTNMVYDVGGSFFVERPKVKWNPLTSMYVLWADMDNNNRSYAMNAILTSPYEDGPFFFRRSFYPDGNRTRDQVIFVNEQNQSVLARTYYQTVEYVLPEAIMQPSWESIKDQNGTIKYRANYHRAWYSTGYDNFNDIYLQRWRKEDLEWDVICVNKITGVQRNVPYGTYTSDGTVCEDPIEYKIVNGQGSPKVLTHFVSPTDPEYSWWMQTSVPAVKAQPWASSYRDGYCGIRKLNDDFDELDPTLTSFSPSDRSQCSNIADNPVHGSLQDKLIGVLRVITTRRAKYMAISELTPDLMDTTGHLSAIEGELESGDMISMIIEMGQFGISVGNVIQSTDREPVRSEFNTAVDYKTRFYQYIYNYNDRALYSLACALDGVCPVNFRDQLTAGQS